MKVAWNPLGPIHAEIEKLYMDRLETAAGYLAGMARSLVPVGKDQFRYGRIVHRAGALRRTIRVTRLPGDPKLNIRVYAGKQGIIDYAVPVEYGTRKMSARPFLRPAWNAMRPRIKRILDGEE